MRNKKTIFRAAFAALVFLTACSDMTTMAALSSFDLLDYFQGDVNLAEKNYAAADYLAGRAKGFVKPANSIKALPLLDEDEPRLMTKFGRRIPEQIGERLIQLGYNVDLTGVSTGVDPAFQAAPQSVMYHPEFILTGSYVRKTSDIDVKIRILDAVTGKERAAFDYTLPRRGDVRKDSKVEPMIMRVDEEQAEPVETMEVKPMPYVPSQQSK